MRVARRALGRSVAASAALFPFLRRAWARPDARPAPRLVLLMQSNGTSQREFWPGPGAFTSPILEPLLGEARLRERAVVVKGLYNHAGGAGNAHDQGFAGLWSGVRTIGSFNDPWGGGPSIDQQIKAALPMPEPFPTLNCGVLASYSPRFKDHRASFSYLGPRRQIPTETDVVKLYARYFPAPGGDGAAAAARLARKRSVLDFVRSDLRAVRAGLGAAERDKLALHEAALREYERRLVLAAGQGGACAVPAPPPGEPLDVTDEGNVAPLVALMLDFIALALGCGLTRVVTFQFGAGGEKWFFKWLGVNENSHDEITHRDDGSDPAVTAKLVTINRWYAAQVARLGRALDALSSGPGRTLLDDSLVVWGNEQADGLHGMDDIPIVLLGRAAGRLPRTGFLLDAGKQDYHRLGTTVLNVMGVPARGFGEEPECGGLEGMGG